MRGFGLQYCGFWTKRQPVEMSSSISTMSYFTIWLFGDAMTLHTGDSTKFWRNQENSIDTELSGDSV